MMEYILIGFLFAIGLYIAPIIIAVAAVAIAFVAGGIAWAITKLIR